MKTYILVRPLVLGVGTAIILAGCATTHYKVTDPQSGNTYFTERIESLSGGTVKLKDTRTGSTVTLNNSEVKEITPEEYKAGLAAPIPAATPPPAAVPPAATTPPAPGTAPTPATGTKP